MRRAELLGLQVGDVDTRVSEALIRCGKGGKRRIVHFDADTAGAIATVTLRRARCAAASPALRCRADSSDKKPVGDRLPAGRWAAVMNADQAISGLTAGAVLVVAAIAAVVSFVHIEHLAVMNGQTSVAAILLPLSIDDSVAAASLVMLRAARAGLGTPRRAGVAQERASGSPVPPGRPTEAPVLPS